MDKILPNVAIGIGTGLLSGLVASVLDPLPEHCAGLEVDRKDQEIQRIDHEKELPEVTKLQHEIERYKSKIGRITGDMFDTAKRVDTYKKDLASIRKRQVELNRYESEFKKILAAKDADKIKEFVQKRMKRYESSKH